MTPRGVGYTASLPSILCLLNRQYSRTPARDRTQLVVLAYETGLVRPGWLP